MENLMEEWVLVPKDATPEMIKACYEAGFGPSGWWKAMVEAAPKPPQD